MKCRPLRRRYIVFELIGKADDSAILSAFDAIAPGRGMTRLVRREGPYVLVRFDHRTAAEIRGKTPITLAQQSAELRSVLTAGTVMKARGKIKKLLRKRYAGDEEAVPVKQNKKMLIQ